MAKRKSVLKSVLVLVGLSLILGVGPAGAYDGPGYWHEDWIDYSNPDWMGGIPDARRLSEMSIPGTHDTMSLHPKADPYANMPVTQSLPLPTQLEAGIRALDIRLNPVGNLFRVFHNTINQYAYFDDDVLDPVVDFLRAHPTETVLMRVAPSEGKYKTQGFRDLFWRYMHEYGYQQTVDGIEDMGYQTSLAMDGNQPHISYYDAINGDLKYAHKVEGEGWWSVVIDSGGDVGKYSSLALDGNGHPHISYYDATNGDLKYAVKIGSGGNCGPNGNEWLCETMDSAWDVGRYTSLALDGNLPHIIYYDATNGALKYVHKLEGGGWTGEVVDGAGDVGQYSSLALDGNGHPHISYYDAINGDLKYAAYVVSGGDYGPNNTWSYKEVDSAGDVGMFTSLALAMDAEGNPQPHISYYDSTNVDLKYAYWDELKSDWDIQTVDNAGDVGRDSSLFLDKAGKPHISYYDASRKALIYAHATGILPEGRLEWGFDTLGPGGDVGLYSSLALDGNDHPHLSYYDWTNGDLKFASLITTTWTIHPVDRVGNVGQDVGQYTSLALDGNGHPHISYYDATNGDLKYAHKLEGGGWWSVVVDSEGDVGQYTSLALDGNGHPHISYYDATNRDLKYAAYVGSGGDCGPNNAWSCELVEDAGDVGQYSSLVLAVDAEGNPQPHISYYDATWRRLKYAHKQVGEGWWSVVIDNGGDVGQYTSLALDTDGLPHISYYDSANGDLKYAEKVGSGGNCGPYGDEWSCELVDDGVEDVGQYSSLALDDNDHPHISYFDWSYGTLKYASLITTTWTIQPVDSAGFVGFFTSLALDDNDDPHISYSDLTNHHLKYAHKLESQGEGWHSVVVDRGFGKWSSLALDSEGQPHISYYDMDNQDLKYDSTDTYWDWVWDPATSDNPNNPTLDEVRGKIVILDDFSGSVKTCRSHPGNPSITEFGLTYGVPCQYIQDRYELCNKAWIIGRKWPDVESQLEMADGGNFEKFYINYLSGSWTSNWGCWIYIGDPPYPSDVADTINNLALDYMTPIGSDQFRRWGIIMSDFPGSGLIDVIINSNPVADKYVLHVKPDVTGGCSSWDDACDLQTALKLAIDGVEIWVAEGTYKPTTGTEWWYDRLATFQLRSGVALYGGFEGTDETSRDERDWMLHETILSGDIGEVGDPSDNSYHVVTGSFTEGTAILDGFTITGGNADGSDSYHRGGGMYNDEGSPTVVNVTFTGNSAEYGGGMGNTNSSSPTLTNVTFSGNSADWGGGIFNFDSSSTALTNTTFSDNTADIFGGGMVNISSSPALTNITFSGNSSYQDGGGMFNWASNPTLVNVTFSDNSADRFGGGMINSYYSSPTLTNVTFSGNSTKYGGGGIYNWASSNLWLTNVTFSGNSASSFGGGMYNDSSSPTLTNSILWGNTASEGAQIYNDQSTVIITSSDIQGGWDEGIGNIDQDPQFVDAAGLDGTPGTLDDDLRLRFTSPAIDAGDNTALPADTLDLDGDGDTAETLPFDLDGNPRISNDKVDMGAYEAPPERIYVYQDATGDNDGTNWGDAFTNLQDALNWASEGVEIWVAEGTYRPAAKTDPDDPRTATFQLKSGVALYGGFAGTDETNRDERDWMLHETILSGDIGTPDVNSDNSYHVVTGSGAEVTAILDGFTIAGGNADGSYPYNNGGGMFNSYSSPTLVNVTFSGNSANNGGGMYNDGGSPALVNVTFSGNSANEGGGMYNGEGIPVLTNVTFSDNLASTTGGGMFNYDSSPALTNVTFSGNSAFWGGGMGNRYRSSPVLTNVTFSGNSATQCGGGMYNNNGSYTVPIVTLTNVTFSGNTSAEYGGGICNLSWTKLFLINNILWGNTATTSEDQIYNSESIVIVTYSDIQGGGWGWIGNINQDPQFVDAANGDLHLRLTSPAIDKGNNDALPTDTLDLDGDGDTAEPLPFDLGGNLRIFNDTVDMGAYEAPPERIYVNHLAKEGSNDGSSWKDAFTNLQDALTWAVDGVEIWVAKGTYKPTTGTDRTATFQLESGVEVYGGFIGTETSRDERDWTDHETILSGDIGTPDDNSDNSYHVVTGSDADATAILDGFTITGGNADGIYPDNFGGGMYNDGASPTLTNLTFSGNSAGEGGGGMYNDGGSPALTNVAISGNSAGEGGGGMLNHSSSPTLTNGAFSGNSADGGGGMFNYDSSPTLTNSILWGNSDQLAHPQIYNEVNSTPTIRYSLIQGGCPNEADCDDHTIYVDPKFVDADGPDDIFGTLDDDLRLGLISPAIDAGDNTALPDGVTSDLDGNPRISNGIVDMGPYEYQHQVLYVIVGTNGDCSSWDEACDLQTALDTASEGTGDEIWVAGGTHKPSAKTGPDDPRTATFQLKSDVALYGGFAGNETRLYDRDWANHETILSGDIGTPDDNSDNSYHVVTSSGADATAILDGFTITGGNANGSYPYNYGGGMFNTGGSSPTLTNVTFSGNTSPRYGGGMYNNGGSSPTLTNCMFSGNSAGAGGGGMYNAFSNPTLTDVEFSGNSADFGGGMWNYQSSPTLTNCTFSGNSATVGGGGIYNLENSSPTLTNCMFSANSTAHGGGMYNTVGSSPTLTNCTFSGNSATGVGGGMYNMATSSPPLTNCILWGNTASIYPQIYHDGVSNSTISYSLIQGECPNGATCDEDTTIYGDPQFVDAANGDLRLRLTSPAIDAGNNDAVPPGVTTDLDGNPRIVHDKVDMGAYEDQHPNIGDTPTGSDVTVVATDPETEARAPVTVAFSEVTTGGNTTTSTDDQGPEVPGGFHLGDPPTYFDLTTKASYSPPVTVCIDYSGIAFPGDKSELRLWHWTEAGWKDVTLLPVDTANKIICGTVNELSVFTVVKPNSPPEAVTDAYSNDEEATLNVSAPGVLDNDSDVDDDPLTAVLVGDVSHGSLTLNIDGAFIYTPSADFNGSDAFSYQACDPGELCDEATVNITVNPVNDQPTASSQGVTTDEDTPVGITLAGSDVETAMADLVFTVVSGPSHGTLSGTAPNLTYTPDENYNGPESFTFKVSDSGDPAGCAAAPCSAALDSDQATVTITVNPVNDAPEVTVDIAEQTVQYSDEIIPVTISASDIDSSELSISMTGAPDWLTLAEEGCLPDGVGLSCTWILDGLAPDAASTYDITSTISDGELDGQADTTVVVEPEEAIVTFHAGNPVALQVTEAGGNSGFFELEVRVRETYPDNAPDGSTPYPGDIGLGQVSMTLVPVGPGGEASGDCAVLGVFDEGYDAFQRVVCSFDAVPVNTYLASVTVDGAYYAGYGEDVLVVYDPSRGFATGGGWFYWPGTEERTSFGFTMEYNQSGTKVKGSMLLIRHLADGSIYQVKSNALYGLSLGVDVENEQTFGWASFSGKATYLEPGWPEAIGNHEFLVYVEDRNEPGSGVDHFWIEVYDKDDNLIAVMSMARPATDDPVQLEEGDIFVPH